MENLDFPLQNNNINRINNIINNNYYYTIRTSGRDINSDLDTYNLRLPEPLPIFEIFSSEIDIPQYLCCPISLLLMQDPIISNDGYTYDRESLNSLLKRTNLSPMTREPFTFFVRNRSIRDNILDLIK